MAATAGALDATSEVLSYNYDLFDKTWNVKNDNYWNPDLSYKNKWRNGDYRQGEAFPLSSTSLSWTVEGRKLIRMGSRFLWAGRAVIPVIQKQDAQVRMSATGQSMVLSMAVSPFSKKKMFSEPWWVYCVDFAVNFGVEAVAFEITNEWYRRNL
jgi:hypothetical protein